MANDRLRILNLGCGTRTHPACVNIDWSMYVRLKTSRLGRVLGPVLLNGPRRERFQALHEPIIAHDLTKGIPAPASTVDAVYHSHVLEHIPRAAVSSFLREIRRVLKPGGIHRIVVPDLEWECRRYLRRLDDAKGNDALAVRHDAAVAALVDQMVREEAAGTGQQDPLRRWIENRLLGNARRRGETHRWMYDRVNLAALLGTSGFTDVRIVDYRTSAIPGWRTIRLDQIDDREYKPGSLYIECAA